MQKRRPIRLLGSVLSTLVMLSAHASAGEMDLAAAREHLQKGRYAEAAEALDALANQDDDPAAVAILRSRVLEAEGKWKDAASHLEKAAEAAPESAALLARLAEVQFRQGLYDEAAETAGRALQLDDRSPLARLVLADCHAEAGRIDEAGEGYRWFVRYYNQFQPTDAETLLLVGRGSAQYARWNSVPQIFGFVVNTLCPDALKADELCWQAHHLSGALLLEKYNRAQALPELKKALAINPRAAGVLALLGTAAYDERDFEEAEEYADEALAVDPGHVGALNLKADLRISSGDLEGALEHVEKALGVNPHDQRTLARQAACYLLMDGPPRPEVADELLSNLERAGELKIANPDRFTRLVLDLARRNPRPGYFLAALSEILDGRWRFELAERSYLAAVRVMPQLSGPKTSLGMLYMRMGETEKATIILDDAFKADPYHVRVSNMRKVLKLLDGYDTIATDHFVIRVDSEADRILGEYIAEYLEEIYPELTKQFGYEPPHRTHFEIFHHAKGLAAHQWFSARMVGLPWVQTVGASTGMVVALSSPTAADEPYNWARVVKHEFVHILTLQRTGFNIPHWFTEALAVTAEGYPRPAEWNWLLRERVPSGRLRTLKNLNDGFVRAESAEDWQFAYCQSRLYAQFMTEKFGPESIPKLLDAYQHNLSTAEAVRSVFEVDLESFEKGYREYLEQVTASLPHGTREATRPLAELERAHRADPDDAAAAGAYAAGLLRARQAERARELAIETLERDPKQPAAALVIAQIEAHRRNVSEAIRVLEPAVDREDPHPRALKLLAQLRLLTRDYKIAIELHELGRRLFPDDLDWLRGLDIAYDKTDATEELKDVLRPLIELDYDDVSPRKRLAELARDERAHEDAVKYGRLALEIDVLDAETHAILGEAYRETGDLRRSIREYEIALKLEPDDGDSRLGLAKSFVASGRTAEARAELDLLLKSHPDHAEAVELRRKIVP